MFMCDLSGSFCLFSLNCFRTWQNTQRQTSGQDLSMVTNALSYGFGVIQDCAQDNNVGLMKMATSLAFSRSGADRGTKCAVACIMEGFFLIMGDTVQTGLLDQVIEIIPIAALKGPLTELLTMCGKKGNGSDKCENAYAFVMCLKQNAIPIGTKAVLQG